ncbi:MAG: hypothetical protein GX601_10260 [Anaerolineales bacterium]|nr:hypothetical protein [Anaerolineales bacterium]
MKALVRGLLWTLCCMGSAALGGLWLAAGHLSGLGPLLVGVLCALDLAHELTAGTWGRYA